MRIRYRRGTSTLLALAVALAGTLAACGGEAQESDSIAVEEEVRAASAAWDEAG